MIFVIGDQMLDRDLLYRRSGRLSPETECPIVELVGATERPGGAGAVCEMVKGLGQDCILLSHECVSLKERHKVDGLEVLRRDADCSEPLDDSVVDSFIQRIEGNPPDLILCADYGKGTITSNLWRRLATTGLRIVVDPARERPFSFYRGAYAICPNRVEWQRETGRTIRFGEAPNWIPCEQGFQAACLKLDRDGLIAYAGGETSHFSTTCRQPKDTCGAGDMVLAALGVGLLRGMSWLAACEFANRCAGAKCAKVGAAPVTLEEVARLAACEPSISESLVRLPTL